MSTRSTHETDRTRRALLSLPRKQQQVVVALAEGWSHRKIADRLGMSQAGRARAPSAFVEARDAVA